MNKADVLALVAAAKDSVAAAMDKLSTDVSALDDVVPPSDDEEKAALKAKVQELTDALAAKDVELSGVKESLSKDEDKISKAQADLSA